MKTRPTIAAACLLASAPFWFSVLAKSPRPEPRAEFTMNVAELMRNAPKDLPTLLVDSF